jgi:hypothetical protein
MRVFEMQQIKRDRRGERGVSLLLVAAGIFSILAMAGLAIDVATLYAANSDAQKAADAAALAGAKMFVMSSSTSGGGVDPNDVCTNGAAQTTMANVAALAAAQANTVGGATAQITNVTCIGTTANPAPNPRIKVTVGRTDLPLFFARIFGTRIASVSATATAEAYNNSSAAGTTWVQTGSVKPWLVANCNPGTSKACGATLNYFFQATTNALNAPAVYLGQRLTLAPYYLAAAPGGVPTYVSDPPAGPPPDAPDICPSTSRVSCGGIGLGGYADDIACANRHQVTCGDALTVSNLNQNAATSTTTTDATECLMHAGGIGNGQGQDDFTTAGPPVTITRGANNPNTAIPTNDVIAQSESVITVPVFNLTGPDPCQPGPCAANTETVIGFLQLGVRNMNANGTIHTVVLNAVGCNPGGSGTPVSGGGVSPIPVRLIQ